MEDMGMRGGSVDPFPIYMLQYLAPHRKMISCYSAVQLPPVGVTFEKMMAIAIAMPRRSISNIRRL